MSWSCWLALHPTNFCFQWPKSFITQIPPKVRKLPDATSHESSGATGPSGTGASVVHGPIFQRYGCLFFWKLPRCTDVEIKKSAQLQPLLLLFPTPNVVCYLLAWARLVAPFRVLVVRVPPCRQIHQHCALRHHSWAHHWPPGYLGCFHQLHPKPGHLIGQTRRQHRSP